MIWAYIAFGFVVVLLAALTLADLRATERAKRQAAEKAQKEMEEDAKILSGDFVDRPASGMRPKQNRMP